VHSLRYILLLLHQTF